MGLREWSAKRRIKDPARGVFRRTSWYDKHGSTWLTGAITVPGIPAFAAEARADINGKWTQSEELPVLVDRANPNQFAILWEEVVLQGPGAQALQSAQEEAARLNATDTPAPGPAVGAPPTPPVFPAAPGANVSVWSQVTVNGRPVSPDSPEAADAMRMVEAVEGRLGLGSWVHPPGTPSAPTSALPATATVRSLADVPSPAPGGAADVTFDVAMPDGTHAAVARITFTTPEKRQLVQPGRTVPVLFDPATGLVLVDTSRLPAT